MSVFSVLSSSILSMLFFLLSLKSSLVALSEYSLFSIVTLPSVSSLFILLSSPSAPIFISSICKLLLENSKLFPLIFSTFTHIIYKLSFNTIPCVSFTVYSYVSEVSTISI